MKKLLCLAFLALAAACAPTPVEPVKVGYDLPKPIKLDVLTVGIQDRTVPGATPNAVDMRPNVAASIKDYINQRITAIGTTGEAVVSIRNAAITQQALAHDDSMFDRPQAVKYTGRAEVEIMAQGRAGYGRVTATATRFTTLPQNPTAEERQNAYNTVLNGLMHDLAANTDAAIRAHLNGFVITAPIMDDPMIPTPMPAPFTYPGR